MASEGTGNRINGSHAIGQPTTLSSNRRKQQRGMIITIISVVSIGLPIVMLPAIKSFRLENQENVFK